MDLTTTIVKGYDLSGGAANWTSADLSDYTNYYIDFIWSNVTGELDGSLLIRQTSDSKVYESIETVTINSKDETRLKNNIGLSEDKINIKFTPNSITGGRLTIKLRAVESNIQEHETNVSAHVTMRANLAAGNITMTGDLLFSGSGSGLPYGEIYVNDNTTVTPVSSAGFTQFLHFNTNGHSNLTTPDHANDHIKITKKGVYMIECCVNIKNSSGAAHDIEIVIAKNNGATIFGNMRRHRTLGTGSDIGAIPICAHVSLVVDDTVEIWISSDSGSSRNVIGEDVVLMLTMVGG